MSGLTGGSVMKKTLKDIGSNMKGTLSAGFLEGSKYPDGTPVAMVAFWNEFGHGGQFPSPPRPFFRTMVAEEKPSWGPKIAKLAKLDGYDGKKVLGTMGRDIDGALKKSINDFTSPGLSLTTLRLRAKFGNHPEEIRKRDVLKAQKEVQEGGELATGTQAKPLNWTGHMLKSIGYKVTV